MNRHLMRECDCETPGDYHCQSVVANRRELVEWAWANG